MTQFEFGERLRRAWWSGVEFSISDATESHSTMVPATVELLRDMRHRLAAYSYADEWLVAVERLMAHVAPDAALFRIDWQRSAPVGLTWYIRFPHPPDEVTFEGIMAHARPWCWSGPSPVRVAQSLRLAGPRGVALRADVDNARRTAVYFRLQRQAGSDPTMAFEGIFDAAGVRGDGAVEASADMARLGASAQVEVIGVDEGVGGSAGGLKFDVADVPVPIALQLLSARGAGAAECERVTGLAAALRARALSYLGLKYSATSFDGWRAYVTTEPARLTSAAGVRVVEKAVGKVQAPHY